MPTFPPLSTERLVIRALRRGDAAPLAAYRNDAETARFQDWPLPFRLEWAEDLVAATEASPWPSPGEWFQLAVEHEGALAGDIGVERSADGAVATIGYTLAPRARGRGLATEAVGAVVDQLFDEGVHRITATLDPDNTASARVVERLGFRYEGRAVGAALVRGEWLDDEVYGITTADRRAWRSRALTPPGSLALVEITERNHGDIARLETHHSQRRFVAPVIWSYAAALFPELDAGGRPVVPWLRAVSADGSLVGFVMLGQATTTNPEPFLWRFLVDRPHQGRGIGRRTLVLVAEGLLAAGHRSMVTSWCPGPGSPEGFYLGLGFAPTGEVIDDEIVGAVDLSALAAHG